MLISIEGVEAAGKTLLSNKLCDSLNNSGVNAVVLRDPGTTKLGEYLRKYLKENETTKEERLYSILAVKASLKREILKHEREDKIVIMDRYIDSTVVYQGLKDEFGVDKVMMLGEDIFLIPQLTFIVDVSLETVISRMNHRKEFDMIEKDFKEAELSELLKYYRQLPKIFPSRIFYFLNGEEPIEKLIFKAREILGF